MKTYFSQKSEITIYQEIKDVFNAAPLVTRNCVKSINSLLFFLSTNKMSPETLNNIYLFLLRSFQSNETYLKYMIWSCIIEISKYTDQGFVGINILLKDLNSKISDAKKSVVLKSLFSIVPDEMVYDFEKYVTQSFVSSDPGRVDSAVVVTYILSMKNFIKSKDWIGNTKVTDDIHGYHVLALLEKAKLINSYEKLNLHKGVPGILAVRIIARKVEQGQTFVNIFKNFLNYKLTDDVVFFEACKSILKMNDELAVQFISQAVQGLRLFLRSPRFDLKFASIKTISLLSLRYAKNVSVINKEIEDLLSDNSKSLSMLAISTLLKTGNEKTVDRLIKLIPEFMSDMDDNYKKISINTLDSLSRNYESKNQVFLDFITTSIQERGNLEFKVYLIDVLKKSIKRNGLRDKILDILCNYIEDSEFYQVSIEILGILGNEIPKSSNPNRYLLHVYNRLILEDNKIRSAALQCLYELSMKMDKSIGYSTIKECTNDSDEMIKELSKFLLNNLENKDKFKYTEEFDINELGDLKEKVLKYMEDSDDTEECLEKDTHEVSPSTFIKECRPICITEDGSDVAITLVKNVFQDKVVLRFNIINNLEDVQVRTGRLGLKVNSEIIKLEVDTILPDSSFIVEKEVCIEEDTIINGVFDYELCTEDDITDTENETMTLKPLQFTRLDRVFPADLSDQPRICKNIRFVLNNDLVNASKKILDILNFKILNQEIADDRLNMSLSGVYDDNSIYVDVNIEYKRASNCILDFYCNDNELLENLTKYFN